MGENRRSSISRATSLEEMGEFWDTHDFTAFDNDSPDVAFDVECAVPIEPELLEAIEAQARVRGISVETLVNLWLQQRLEQAAP
jgi:predicted HicB family RNase H-like nuclease